MNEDGSIDWESFKKLLKTQEAADNAITILGSTGEALNIDLGERKAVLDFAVKLNLKVPIMAGIGGFNLNEQSAWIKHLNTLDIDAYLLVVPLYAKPGIHGQYGWFKQLMDLSQKPCMLYNIPGRTAKILEYETLSMLCNHPKLWAIKEASGSIEEFKKYAEIAPKVRIMSGDDAMLPAFAPFGAKGVVSVLSNVWPEATHEYARQCTEGTFKDNDIWERAVQALFCASNPIPAKAALYDQGKIKSPTVRLPLSTEDMPDIGIVRKSDKEINRWLSQG